MKYSESQALSKLAAYCSKAERAEYDVRRIAATWQLDADMTDRIITRLKKENFLNEERFCRSFIHDKVNFNKWGTTKIRFELRKKNVSETAIDYCLSGLGNERFEQALLNLLSTKIKTVRAATDYERSAKLVRFALGRGYPLELIKKTLQKLNLKDEEYTDSFF